MTETTEQEVEVVFTMEEVLDIMLAAQERNVNPKELIRQAVLEDLFR